MNVTRMGGAFDDRWIRGIEKEHRVDASRCGKFRKQGIARRPSEEKKSPPSSVDLPFNPKGK